LLDEIASLSETIRVNHGEARYQLIERWIGHEEHFVNV
jgi:ATP-dependent DNA helicase RecG